MGEGDAEAAAATLTRFIVETGLVALAEFPGDVEPKTGAFAFSGVEGFEQVLQLLLGHTGPIVRYLQDGKVAVRIAEQPQPDLPLGMKLSAVAQAILHQIGQNLGQLMRVHACLDGAAFGQYMQCLVGAGGGAEFAGEAMEPVFQVEQLRFRLTAAGQLQHVLDDQVHSPRMILNDLSEPSIRFVQRVGLL